MEYRYCSDRQNASSRQAGPPCHNARDPGAPHPVRQQEDELQALADQIKAAENKVAVARSRLADVIEKLEF